MSFYPNKKKEKYLIENDLNFFRNKTKGNQDFKIKFNNNKLRLKPKKKN